MVSVSRFLGLREFLLIILPGLLLIAAGFWATMQFVKPAPPESFVIATASKGSPYHQLAERYREVLARSGIDLQVRETNGTFENLKLVRDPASGVGAAFLQGGVSNGRDAPEIVSLGRVLYEPLWIFHNIGVKVEQLSDLKGKRILVGPAGGGTNHLAQRMLAASGVAPDTASLINMELPKYVDALNNGEADAGFLVLAPTAQTIRRLFASPNVRLLSIAQADAYSQRFPALTRLDLKQGIVDFARNIPPTDTSLVATTTALVVRDDLHPALASLLTQALLTVHAEPVVNANGEAPLFQRAGDFPLQSDPEFQLSDNAKRVYRNGAPFLQRYLPFWLATLADRMAVMLLPILGILLPVLRFAPSVYSWSVRRRLLFWYNELKKVESGLHSRHPPPPDVLSAKHERIEEIEAAVNLIPIPLGFTDQLYDLRQHIDAVRNRLSSFRPTPV